MRAYTKRMMRSSPLSENVGPPLDPWESIVFSAIKPLPPPPSVK